MNVNLSIPKGSEFIWRVAKAHAKDEGISLSQLVCKAVMYYCSRNNVILRD